MSETTKNDRERMRKDALRRLYALPARKKNKKKGSVKRKMQSGSRRTSITTTHAR